MMSDAAIVSVVTGLVTIATLWIKLHYGQKAAAEKVASVETKIDQNTLITSAGATAAVANAKTAANSACDAKNAVESISKKLNGGIDSAIAEGIKPIQKQLEAHTEQDARDLAEVKAKFDSLTEYVHQRNHDLLNAINSQSLKIDALLEKK